MLLPVYINTYPAPENYFYIYTYLIPLRAGEAWEVFENIFPTSEKYLYTLFRRRRSAYIHLSGAGEAGEVFIYTELQHTTLCVCPSRAILYQSTLCQIHHNALCNDILKSVVI